MSRVSHVPKDAEIVIYCSIGYRSEKIGERLKTAGFTKVRNLFGGIFAWANRGYPVKDPSGKTSRKVHGYDAKWGKLLNSGVEIVK